MKNLAKKQSKVKKLTEKSCKKPLHLQFKASEQLQFDQNMVINTLLSPTTNKLMQQFSNSQKKVISQQFTKMIRTLKKKLTSPDKNAMSQRSKIQTKTQRFEFIDPNNCSKQTIRKNICTDRKPINLLSPKTKNKFIDKQPEILSPKRSKRNLSSVCDQYLHRNSNIISPKKTKKSSKESEMLKCSKKGSKSKRIKTKEKVENDNIYFLYGNNFVQIKQAQVKQMESQILQQSGYQKDSQLQYVWKQFIDEKKKLTRDRIQSQQSNNVTMNLFQFQSQQKSNIVTSGYRQNKASVQKVKQDEYKKDGQQYQKQVKESQLCIISKINQNEDTKPINILSQNKNKNLLSVPEINMPETLNFSQVESQCFNDNNSNASPLKQKKYDTGQDIIKMRTNAANLQIKTNKQILEQLLKAQKIDNNQFQQHMDLVIQIYDKEMTEIQNLKQVIFVHQQKVDNLIQNTKQNLKISEKINEIDAKNVLQTIFGQYKNEIKYQQKKMNFYESIQKSKMNNKMQIVKSVGQGRQKNLQTKWPVNILQQLDEYNNYESKNQNSPIKSQDSNDSSNSPKKRVQQIESFQKFQQQLQQNTKQIKHKIEARIGVQLGILNIQPEVGIRTSVISVFQFIKNFFLFLKTYHLSEFLTYVNMPYGYSIEQRLRYMQGYDDDEDEQDENKKNGIIYGLQQVIRPSLLDIFHDNFYFRNNPNDKNPHKQLEKLHNKAIFNAINQAMNQFRPYFQINGPPYQWTVTEKALTYYFIRQDCYEELLQKVQLQVLKWSSSLCGLIIPQAIHKNARSNQPLSIQQIFESYTIETDCELLEQRQAKVMKQQKIQIDQTYFQWLFFDQFQTAFLYELSSCLLEDLATQISMQILRKQSKLRICQLFQDCGVSQSEIQL